MALPTRKVTCRLYDQQGNPAPGARIQFKLTATEMVDGIVAPEVFEQESDADGVAEFDVVPNALGVNGTQYQVRAWNPDTGKKFIDGFCTVPDQDCYLEDILTSDPPPTLDSAQQALAAAQAYSVAASASADEADASEAAAAASATEAATSGSEAAASATAAADSEGEAAASATTAATQAGIATTKASEAAASETAAASSATAADASAQESAQSATESQNSAAASASSAAQAEATLTHYGPTPQPNPQAGWGWIDSATGRRYTWLVDADSGQWVETGASIQIGYDTAVVAVAAKDTAVASATAAEADADTATTKAGEASTSASGAAADRALAQTAAVEAQTAIPPVQKADYAALRAYAGTATKMDVTGYLVTSAPSGIAGQFTRDDSDTTSTDNGGTTIVDASGRRWKRVFNGAVKAAWFGAKFDGVNDDTAPIQSAIDYAIYVASPRIGKVELESGHCKTTDTIHLGYGTSFTEITLEGAGSPYVGESAFGGTVIVPTFSDRSPINVQGARRARIRHLALVGLNNAFVKNSGLGGASATVDDTDVSAWVDPTLHANATSRYAPYAGITVDAYSGPAPATSYPDVTYPAFLGAVTQYDKAFSSNVVVEDSWISGFVVGVAIQPGNSDGNGDFVSFRDTQIAFCVYGVSVGQSQSRQVNFYNGQISNCHTALTNNKHGKQSGKFGGIISGTAVGGVIQLFDMSTGFCGPMCFEGCYGELVWRIGNIGSPASGSFPIAFSSSEFKLIDHPAIRGVPRMLVEGSGSLVRFSGGALRLPSIGAAGGILRLDGTLVVGNDMTGASDARALAQRASGGLLPIGQQIVADESPEFRVLSSGGQMGIGKNSKGGGRANTLGRLVQSVQFRDSAASQAPVPCPRTVSVIGIGSVTVSIAGISGTIDFTGTPATVPYGIRAGDLIQHDTTGTVFLVTGNAGLVADVTALNNYYNPGSGAVLRSAVAGGSIYVLCSRQYATTFALLADVTAGSNVLTNVTRGDGYAGFVATDLAVGDFLHLPAWTSGPFATGTTITAIDATAKTITLSNNAATGTTATKQPLHFWVRG